MIIFGIDPGTRITGYGVIETNGPKVSALDYGCIRPPPNLILAQRYRIIFEGLETLLDRHRPDAVAVELQFVLKNVQSAIKLGMARAMALLAAARREIPIFEYAPTKAKRAAVGEGQASKLQVQRMIQTILRLPALPEPEDAADALALALCHAGSLCMNQFAASSKKKTARQPLLNAMDSRIGSKSP
jgi:crossover junction endodeoxyribonuclease RuvC